MRMRRLHVLLGLPAMLGFAPAPLPLDRDTADPAGGALTRPGVRMGTLEYMSPEQWGEDLVDERTDLWAVGVMLHEMVTREHPLAPADLADLVAFLQSRKAAGAKD